MTEPKIPFKAQLVLDALAQSLSGLKPSRVYDNTTTQCREVYRAGRCTHRKPKEEIDKSDFLSPWGYFPDAV